MRRILLAITFICLVSGSILAGDIPISDAPAPPPPSHIESARTSINVSDQLTNEVLSGLMSLLTSLTV